MALHTAGSDLGQSGGQDRAPGNPLHPLPTVRLGAAGSLFAEHGADLGMPDLAVRLAADCPRAQAASPAARCFAHFPQLLDVPAAN